MRLNFALLRSRWHGPVMLAAGFVPLPLLLCARMTPDLPWRGLPVAAAYVLLAWLCTILPGKRRLAFGIAGAALLGAVGVWLLPWREAWPLLSVPAVYMALLLTGLAGGDAGMSIALPSVGLGLHIVAQFMQLIDRQAGTEMALSVIYALRASFVLFGFLILFALNRNSLREAAAKGSPAPLTVRRRNWLMTAGMGLLTLLIACLPAVVRFFERLWNDFVAALLRLIWLLMSMLVPDDAVQDGPMGAQPDAMLAAEGETSALWRALEKIMLAVAVIAAAVIAVVALRILWRKLRALVAWAMERLRIFAQAASEDYQDEISDTREGGERTSLLRRRVRRRDPLKGVDPAKLPPRERVRFYYLKTWMKRPDWEAGNTARENLPGDAAGIYERARYSLRDVSEAEAEEFGRRLDRRQDL